MAFDKRKALQNALTFAQQGKWDKAIAEYQAILKVDPNDLTVCNNLGDLYARSGRVPEAIEQYLKLGQLYRADGLSVKAIAVYKKIVKLDPTRTEAHLACADLYEEQGLSGEAKLQLATAVEHYARAGNTLKVIEVYQHLAQLDPTNHVVLTKLADLMLREGMREQAAGEYERAALAAQAAGQLAESKRLFQKVHDLMPESPQANLALGEQHLREGRYAEAAEALSKASAGDAMNARSWCLLGEAYLGLAQASEAVTALERALDLGLPVAGVWRPLATALVQAGRADEGISLCLRLSEEAVSGGNPDEAVAVCRDLLAVAPHLAPVHVHLVGLLQELGQGEEARSAAYALAAAHVTSGETEAAITVYHQLLERDPSDVETQRRLEELERGPAPPAQPEEELPIPVMDAAPADLVAADVVPADAAVKEVAATDAAPTIEEAPVFIWEGAAPEEQRGLELSPENAPTLGEETTFQAERGVPLDARSGQVFELDESGELAGIHYSPQAPHGGALDRLGRVDGPRVELPRDSAREELSGSEALAEEEEGLGEVAEQLAEAEVYLKYGLTEKARDRLLEVARLAPDNVVVRRRLKALYLEGSQVEEACGEILAIARILGTHGQPESARREIQEGLSLAPDHPELQELLTRLSGMGDTPGAEHLGVSAFMESPPAEAPAFEFLESIEIPETLGLEGELSPAYPSASGSEADGMGETGAPSEVGPTDRKAPDVARPEPAAAAGPSLAFPLETAGAEASLLELSAEVGLEADVALPQEEEVPPEFDLLLEQPAEEPALALEAGEEDLDQVMAEDLAEGEFYLSQGMVEEARAVHGRMEARALLHPAAIQLGRRLGPSSHVTPPEAPEVAAAGVAPSAQGAKVAQAEVSEAPVPADAFDTSEGPLPEAVPFPEPAPPGASVAPMFQEASSTFESMGMTPPPRMSEGPSHEVTPEIQAVGLPPPTSLQTPPEEGPFPDSAAPNFAFSRSGGEPGAGGFVNLGAELAEDLGAEELAAAGSASAPLIEDLLREFQQGMRERLDEKNFETHYNLGNAYKDMDLFDEAIQEFRLAAQDPARALTCANLLGLCYLAKGEPDAAIRELRAGLEVRGHPRETYHGLRYDLGAAYDTQGDLGRALEAFETLQEENPLFRDVQGRVTDLRARLQQPHAASIPALPLQAGEPPKRPKDARKKISFI